jgi:hypothetical protein
MSSNINDFVKNDRKSQNMRGVVMLRRIAKQRGVRPPRGREGLLVADKPLKVSDTPLRRR